jgi:hypothetical protein
MVDNSKKPASNTRTTLEAPIPADPLPEHYLITARSKPNPQKENPKTRT